MGLQNLKIPKVDVPVPGGDTFAVRGLSFVDMKLLFTKYGSEIGQFFDMIKDGSIGADMKVEEAGMLAATLINQAPAMVAEIITLAADEPEAFAVVLMLPFPVQTEALQTIGKLTFGTEGALKKFLQTAKVLLGSVQPSQKNP